MSYLPITIYLLSTKVTHLSTYLFICLFIIYLPIDLHLFIYLPTYYLLICLFIYLWMLVNSNQNNINRF
jgi:hypothetical protein